MQHEHAFLEEQDKDINGGCLYAIVCILGLLVLIGVCGLLIAAFIYGFSHL